MAKRSLLIWCFMCSVLFGYCQEGFVIDNGRRSTKVKFDLINNLIIVPVELNGVSLSFLVDTGVNTSVLINLDPEDSLELGPAQKIKLRGLGGDQFIDAYRSDHNQMKIGKVSTKDLTLFLIYDEQVNFSPRMGVPVHGIIGHDLFKNLIVEINYSRRFLRFHDPYRFSKKMRRYQEEPMRLYRNKPYIQAEVEIEGEEQRVTLLVDSGLGDALWLFEDSTGITIPKRHVEDILGLGLLGEVRGKRGRIASFEIGGNIVKEMIVAFPDSAAAAGLKLFKERRGSIGGGLLSRFNLVLDYPGQHLYLRPNKRFDKPFHYDMSGIVLEHSGFLMVETLVRDFHSDRNFPGDETERKPIAQLRKHFELKPSLQIVSIRENSPAERAGLKIDDIILRVNGRPVYKYDLDDLTGVFSSEAGKQIRLEVARGEKRLVFTFYLEKML